MYERPAPAPAAQPPTLARRVPPGGHPRCVEAEDVDTRYGFLETNPNVDD